MTGFVNRVRGWSTSETEVLLANVRSELRDPQFHMYVRMYFVYGRKP